MRLHERVDNITVTNKIRMGRNSVMETENSDGTTTTLNLTELAALDDLGAADFAKIDGITNGTIAAGKAVVVDANKDAGDFRNLDCVNLDAGASGTAGTVDVFPSTASKGKLVLSATDNTNNDAVTITNAAHGQATSVTIPDGGAATTYLVQSTAALTLAEADFLDGATAGTQVASKAVVADANVNTGISKVTELHIGASGSETQVTATAAEINQGRGDTSILYETVTTTNVITAAETGKTFFLNSATGFASTLPAPALGLWFKFIVTTAPTSGNHTVGTDSADNIIHGQISTGEDAAGSVVTAAAADIINFVANTAIVGDYVECVSDGTNWYVSGMCAVQDGMTTVQTA